MSIKGPGEIARPASSTPAIDSERPDRNLVRSPKPDMRLSSARIRGLLEPKFREILDASPNTLNEKFHEEITGKFNELVMSIIEFAHNEGTHPDDAIERAADVFLKGLKSHIDNDMRDD